MALPILIAGIVLLVVNAHWFKGQHDVGLVLTWTGAALLLLQLLFVVLGIAAAASTAKSSWKRRF